MNLQRCISGSYKVYPNHRYVSLICIPTNCHEVYRQILSFFYLVLPLDNKGSHILLSTMLLCDLSPFNMDRTLSPSKSSWSITFEKICITVEVFGFMSSLFNWLSFLQMTDIFDSQKKAFTYLTQRCKFCFDGSIRIKSLIWSLSVYLEAI